MQDVIDLAPGLTLGLASEPLLDAAGGHLATRLEAPAVALAHGLAGAAILAALACGPVGRAIVILKAHSIDLGGPLGDLLAAAGGVPVEAGSADRASVADLEAALDAGAAAAVFVAADRLARLPLPGLPVFRHAARARNVPTIVVAPDAHAIDGLLDAGADLVAADAAAVLGGPPLGIVGGGKPMVERARAAQRKGLGHALRPAAGQVEALLSQLEATAGGEPDRTRVLHERRGRLADRLGHLPGLHLEPSATGVVLHLDPATRGSTARDLAHALSRGEPVLLVDDRLAGRDRLALDLLRPAPEAFARALDALGRTLEGTIPPAPWP